MYRQRNIAQQYLQQQINNASPAQQLVMLYDGAIRFCMKAREAIEQGNIQERHNNNRRAMEIVSYLMDILDIEKGGEVAARLQRIYGFLVRRLLEVDFTNDPRICDEVMDHLKTLRASWDRIARNEGVARSASADGGAAPIKEGPKSAVA